MSSVAPDPDLEIFCPKCGAWVWHEAKDARWMKCLGCGDLHDLSDPGTQVAEEAMQGKQERV